MSSKPKFGQIFGQRSESKDQSQELDHEANAASKAMEPSQKASPAEITRPAQHKQTVAPDMSFKAMAKIISGSVD